VRTIGFACTIALVACTKKDTGKTDVTPVKHDAASAVGSAVKPAVDPQARAKDILDRQLEALKKSEKDDPSLLATFDRDAVLLVPDPRLVSEPTRGFRDAITQRAPHEGVIELSFGDVVARGNDHAVWLSATLAVKQTEETYSIRVTELATAEAGWKVAAAAFTIASEPSASSEASEPFGNTTDAGPLTALLARPAVLAEHLAADASVFTYSGRFDGAAAKDVIAKLPEMTVDGKPREVHGNGWGYAIAQLSYVQQGRKFPLRISALLVAVPVRGDGWEVVALHLTH
jgi:hypothetical protein